MAALTIQDVPAAGLGDVVFASATAGGDTVAYGSKSAAGWEQYSVLLLVKNADTGSHTATVGGVALAVANGKTGIIPVPNEGLNDPSVAVTYDAVTSVTVAAIRILP
jgi:hypothetical protein